MYSEEYIVARRTLLAAMEALEGHREALVLVGAQAIYLHTGAAQFAVAEFTTDGDVAVDPRVCRGTRRARCSKSTAWRPRWWTTA